MMQRWYFHVMYNPRVFIIKISEEHSRRSSNKYLNHLMSTVLQV